MWGKGFFFDGIGLVLLIFCGFVNFGDLVLFFSCFVGNFDVGFG